MTATAVANPSPVARKFRWLIAGIVIVCAAYSAGWFVVADQVEKRLTAHLADGRANGFGGECINMDVRGFPFRIGLFCDKVNLDDTRRGASASFGALRTAAQVYQPGHAIIELDGPAELRVAPDLKVSADWTLLHASVRATLSGLERSSLTYDNLTGTVRLPVTGDSFGFGASHGEVHLRRNGNDLDAALSVDKLDLRPENGASFAPPANIAADLTFVDKASWMGSGIPTPAMLRGSKGELRQMTLDLGSGMNAKLSGPFSVNDQGLISGELSLTMTNIDAWRQNLVTLIPDDANLVNNTANMLKALANGKNEATVKLNVRDGTAFLAFIPIGVLPTL